MTSNVNVIIKGLSKTRKIILFTIIGIIMFVAIWGLRSVYAFYYESITTGILANKVGNFDLGDGDINMLIYKENDEGKFTRVYSIPTSYYQFNDNLTSCTTPCNDGSGNCEYTYDATNSRFTLTSNQKITCKFYFEKESDSDINVFVLIEDENGSYANSDGSKTYSLISNVPAYGYVYTDTYKCDTSATVTYNSETKKFNVETSSKNNCYVYFDKEGSSDITVNVYVQESYGSSVYNSVTSIPSNRIFVLNESKSTCKSDNGTSTGAAISYTDGYINITATEKQTCDVYLDLESN